jgi:subtilisin family serine protease
VKSCTPDLPAATDVGISLDEQHPRLTESAVKDVIYNDGTASWNEEKFLTRWSQSVCFRNAVNVAKDYYRQWNWVAVNWPKVQNDPSWPTIKNNLKTLKLTQLDTGYSKHSKVRNGYDFTLDMDFIDNDQDARDEEAHFLLKFPNHGTRTASLVIGGKITEGFEYDGNRGILTENDESLIKLVPYRVAKTVILIGRGKDMVSAAQHAVNNKTDVMFMCMGSYPRPMIEEVARTAYEKGVIWVCAAGNEVEMVIAPALYPGTIAVAGINPELKPWSGSSNGSAVDIAAPGESVYVPFVDKDGKEIMCYGDGTSYATPHVASAAMLWKAKHKDAIASRYNEPWQIVEAFRTCLKQSAQVPAGWKTDKYGAGILDIPKLLSVALPPAAGLKNAYAGKPAKKPADLGVRETVHFLWNTLKRKLKPGVEESALSEMPLSNRARVALSAMSNLTASVSRTESTATVSDAGKKRILAEYFESQQ